ncbi:MAG: TAXI family TRAP transporter solute-binding subunit, partial [Dehalococcoidia bacterium]|nr:TAXI family TRAP transporter solute-binding subunit [Dehalococcoidia bacterium]
MRRITLSIITVLVIVGLVIISCSPKPASETSGPVTLPAQISMGTFPPGSASYVPATAIAAAVSRHTPMHMTVEPAVGGIPQAKLLAEKKIEFAMIVAYGIRAGFEGAYSFASMGPQPFRLVATGWTMPFGFAARGDSGIKTPADFKGKRVHVQMAGEDSSIVYTHAVLAAYGLTVKDLKAATTYARSSDSDRDLIENRVDVIVGSLGGAKQVEIEKAVNAFAVPISHEESIKKKIQSAMPGLVPITLKAGTPTAPVDTTTYAQIQSLYTVTGVSDEIVYQVTKAMYDNYETEMAPV